MVSWEVPGLCSVDVVVVDHEAVDKADSACDGGSEMDGPLQDAPQVVEEFGGQRSKLYPWQLH